MTVESVFSLVAGALLGIPALIASPGSAIIGLVTRRAGWTYAAALLAIGPLFYLAATPRFQYVAPIGIAMEIAALVVLMRRRDIGLATVLVVLPLVFFLSAFAAV